MGKGWAILAIGVSAGLSIGILFCLRTERFEGQTLEPKISPFLMIDLEKGPGRAPMTFPGEVHTSKSGEVAVLTLRLPDMEDARSIVVGGGRVKITHREVRLPGTTWALGATRVESGSRIYPCGRPMGVFFAWLSLAATAPVLLWGLSSALSALIAPRRVRDALPRGE